MPEYYSYWERYKNRSNERKNQKELSFRVYFNERTKKIKDEREQELIQNLWYDDPIVRKNLLQTMQIEVSPNKKTKNPKCEEWKELTIDKETKSPENQKWKEFIIGWIKCKKIKITIPDCEWYHWRDLTFYISDKKYSGKELKDISNEWKSRMLNKSTLSELLKIIDEGATAHNLPSDTNIDAELNRKLRWYKSINLIKELLRSTENWKCIWNEFYLRLKDQENWEQVRIYSDWNIDNAWELWWGYILFQ